MALVWDCIAQKHSLPRVYTLLTGYLVSFLSSTLFPLFPSPAWLSEPILSLSHLNVNLRKIMCTVYIIYMVLMVLSHTHLMVCYLPTPSKLTLLIVQFIRRVASAGTGGRREFLSPSGTKTLRKDISSCPVTVFTLLSFLCAVAFCFPRVELLLDENLKALTPKVVAIISYWQTLMFRSRIWSWRGTKTHQNEWFLSNSSTGSSWFTCIFISVLTGCSII